MDCYLEESKYTWKNAFLWGNFKNHIVQLFNKENPKKVRAFHSLIAAIEFFPIVSQIISVVEKKRADKEFDKRYSDRVNALLSSHSYAPPQRSHPFARPIYSSNVESSDDDFSDSSDSSDDVPFASAAKPCRMPAPSSNVDSSDDDFSDSNDSSDDVLFASAAKPCRMPAPSSNVDSSNDDFSDSSDSSDDVSFFSPANPQQTFSLKLSKTTYDRHPTRLVIFEEEQLPKKQIGAAKESSAVQLPAAVPSVSQASPIQGNRRGPDKLPELDEEIEPKEDLYIDVRHLLDSLEEGDENVNFKVIQTVISAKKLNWTDFLKQLDPKKFFQLFESAINQKDAEELRLFLSCTNRDALLSYFLDAANEDSVVLEIEGKELTFNKNFLALFFPYFQTMFNGKFREASSTKVVLHDIQYYIFLDVLDYVLFNANIPTNNSNIKDYLTTFKFFQISTSCFKEWIDLFFENTYAPLLMPLHGNAFSADNFANEAMEKKVKEILKQPFGQYHLLEPFLPFVPNLYPEIKTRIETNLDIIPVRLLEKFFSQTPAIIPTFAIRKKLLEILSKETSQPGLFNLGPSSINFLIAMAPFVPDLHKAIGNFLGRCKDPLSDFSPLESCQVIFRSLIQTHLNLISAETNFFLGETITDLTKYLPLLKKLSLKEASVFFCKAVLPLATNLELLEITINDPNVIQYLHQLPNLKTLHVKLGENITDEDLRELSRLKQIKKLDLSACQKITDEGFKHLDSLKKLKILILYSKGITFNGLSKECLSYLTNCAKLKKLIIGGRKVKDETIADIATNFPKLRKLVIEASPNVTANGLQRLQNLKKLRDLQIIECAQIQNEAQIFQEEDEEPLKVNRPSKST